MRLNRFDLNLLLALDALLQERNVTRAAERVFLSQPAMSSALARLREFFGDPLLVRVGRDLELTPRGRALLEPVHEMLLKAQAVLDVQPVFDPATAQRTFKMMIPDFVVPWLMPGTLRRLLQAAPGIRVELESWSASGPSRLVEGAIQLLVTLDSPRILGLASFPDSLCSAELQSMRWVCAVSADHPVIKDELTREQFLRHPHIYVRAEGDMLPVAESVRRHLRIELDVRVTTEDVLEIPFMLPGTPLIALMPEGLARQLAACLSIKTFEIPAGIVPARRVDLFWHRRDESDPGHAWMRDLIVAASAGA
jgi:LysR family nod box-dependent transcriptional activator